MTTSAKTTPPASEPSKPKATSSVPPKRNPKSPAGAVVGNDAKDTVSLAAIVFKSKVARKSLTVHHLQRRLVELGYGEAGADRDGTYGDLTHYSVTQYQSDHGLEATAHPIDYETLVSIFDNDDNVIVTL